MSLIGRINDYSLKKRLYNNQFNVMNIETLSTKEIKRLDSNNQTDEWREHKRKVFMKWISLHKDYNQKLIDRANGLASKMKIDLSKSDEEILFSLERKEFTNRRAFKIIEIPTSDSRFKNRNSLFVYKGVKVYKENALWSRMIHSGTIYMLEDQMIMLSDDNHIDWIVEYKDVLSMNLKKQSINISTTEDVFEIRYKDLDVIFLSLNRVIKSPDIEKTIEFSI